MGHRITHNSGFSVRRRKNLSGFQLDLESEHIMRDEIPARQEVVNSSGNSMDSDT